MRRGIVPIVGRRIVGVSAGRCAKKPILISPPLAALRTRIVGRTIVGIDRIGKRVVIRLDGGTRRRAGAIVIEPRMTGLVLLAEPPTAEHVRLRIQLSGAGPEELLFWDRRGLGLVRLLNEAELDERYGPEKIGPDALAISSQTLQQRLSGSKRAIKVALLDQRAVAGIGNLYAAEILHLASIHPQRTCDRLRPSQWSALHAATVEVLQAAVRAEGSTLSDGTYRNALSEAGSYQNHHRVYGREGELCPTCGRNEIERIVQAQRSTFFCRGCQPRRGK